MALNPLAMDMMLPALPHIGSFPHRRPQPAAARAVGLHDRIRRRPFVIGPLSDRYGRRPILLAGMVVYTVASVLAIVAPSFETLLIARVAQGLGTSATRVIAVSIVRDCYAGRRMASVMSLVMMIFIAVPVIAPSFGQPVMLSAQWRGIFVCLMLYGVLALVWSALRLPETLPVPNANRSRSQVLARYSETLSNRQTLGYALAAGGIRARCSPMCSRRSRCSPRSIISAIIFRWPSRRSRSASRWPAFSIRGWSAGSACG